MLAIVLIGSLPLCIQLTGEAPPLMSGGSWISYQYKEPESGGTKPALRCFFPMEKSTSLSSGTVYPHLWRVVRKLTTSSEGEAWLESPSKSREDTQSWVTNRSACAGHQVILHRAIVGTSQGVAFRHRHTISIFFIPTEQWASKPVAPIVPFNGYRCKKSYFFFLPLL